MERAGAGVGKVGWGVVVVVTGWMHVSAASDISLPVKSGFTHCVQAE